MEIIQKLKHDCAKSVDELLSVNEMETLWINSRETVSFVERHILVVNGINQPVWRVFVRNTERSDDGVGWVLNSSKPGCMQCGNRFSSSCARHHCRACGSLVCEECSNCESDIVEFPEFGYQRVCVLCFLKNDHVHAVKIRQRGPGTRSREVICSPIAPRIVRGFLNYEDANVVLNMLIHDSLKPIERVMEHCTVNEMEKKWISSKDTISFIEEDYVITNKKSYSILRVYVRDNRRADDGVGWVLNCFMPGCMECGLEFKTDSVRHHCRACGKVVCGFCSNNEGEVVELPEFGPQRICNLCCLQADGQGIHAVNIRQRGDIVPPIEASTHRDEEKFLSCLQLQKSKYTAIIEAELIRCRIIPKIAATIVNERMKCCGCMALLNSEDYGLEKDKTTAMDNSQIEEAVELRRGKLLDLMKKEIDYELLEEGDLLLDETIRKDIVRFEDDQRTIDTLKEKNKELKEELICFQSAEKGDKIIAESNNVKLGIKCCACGESVDLRLEGETSRLKAENIRLEGEASGLEAERIRLEGEASGLEAERIRLKGEASGLEAERIRLEGEASGLEAERIRLEGEASGLEAERVRLEGEASGLEAERIRLEGEASRLGGLETDRIHVEEEKLAQLMEKHAQQEEKAKIAVTAATKAVQLREEEELRLKELVAARIREEAATRVAELATIEAERLRHEEEAKLVVLTEQHLIEEEAARVAAEEAADAEHQRREEELRLAALEEERMREEARAEEAARVVAREKKLLALETKRAHQELEQLKREAEERKRANDESSRLEEDFAEQLLKDNHCGFVLEVRNSADEAVYVNICGEEAISDALSTQSVPRCPYILHYISSEPQLDDFEVHDVVLNKKYVESAIASDVEKKHLVQLILEFLCKYGGPNVSTMNKKSYEYPCVDGNYVGDLSNFKYETPLSMPPSIIYEDMEVEPEACFVLHTLTSENESFYINTVQHEDIPENYQGDQAYIHLTEERKMKNSQGKNRTVVDALINTESWANLQKDEAKLKEFHCNLLNITEKSTKTKLEKEKFEIPKDIKYIDEDGATGKPKPILVPGKVRSKKKISFGPPSIATIVETTTTVVEEYHNGKKVTKTFSGSGEESQHTTSKSKKSTSSSKVDKVRTLAHGTVVKPTAFGILHKRQLILTDTPSLIYRDTKTKEIKGELRLMSADNPAVHKLNETTFEVVVNKRGHKFINESGGAQYWIDLIQDAIES